MEIQIITSCVTLVEAVLQEVLLISNCTWTDEEVSLVHLQDRCPQVWFKPERDVAGMQAWTKLACFLVTPTKAKADWCLCSNWLNKIYRGTTTETFLCYELKKTFKSFYLCGRVEQLEPLQQVDVGGEPGLHSGLVEEVLDLILAKDQINADSRLKRISSLKLAGLLGKVFFYYSQLCLLRVFLPQAAQLGIYFIWGKTVMLHLL